MNGCVFCLFPIVGDLFPSDRVSGVLYLWIQVLPEGGDLYFPAVGGVSLPSPNLVCHGGDAVNFDELPFVTLSLRAGLWCRV